MISQTMWTSLLLSAEELCPSFAMSFMCKWSEPYSQKTNSPLGLLRENNDFSTIQTCVCNETSIPHHAERSCFKWGTAKTSASEPRELSGASTCMVLACPPAHSVPIQDKGRAHSCVWCCRWRWGVCNLPPDCSDSRAVVSVVSGNKQCIQQSASQEVKNFHYQRRRQ